MFINSLHFLPHCFKYLIFYPQGLKTGMYYLRTKPAAQAIQFTVDKTRLAEANKNKQVGSSDKPEKISAAVKKEDSEGKENVPEDSENVRNKNMAVLACSLQNKEDCLMCGS